ncbi:MAG TPA: hypothetical protein VGH88_09060, partial [Streptosporangiaceae bacterium]
MAPTRSPAETARTALELARAGRFADLRELFAPALRDMVPPAALQAAWAAALSRQGGRDYQVTVADDLARWRAALAARPQVTIRVYPADDHLFFPGSGPSSPAGYEPAQHVDPA